ncbi:hypothetical protein AAFF_G00164970 [Aldrovandia affinis]|uniref:Uncharacterized protein n=1 Tax=Aldrovandia affinis TaxID=143900 RepID=A0AAD7RMQ3_9TELE|nr:hypothetical protein AAFF_G00164970 [Aldrovandia affinis]
MGLAFLCQQTPWRPPLPTTNASERPTQRDFSLQESYPSVVTDQTPDGMLSLDSLPISNVLPRHSKVTPARGPWELSRTGRGFSTPASRVGCCRCHTPMGHHGNPESSCRPPAPLHRPLETALFPETGTGSPARSVPLPLTSSLGKTNSTDSCSHYI